MADPKAVVAILGKGKPPPMEDEEPEAEEIDDEEPGLDNARMAAAERVLSALESGDPKMLDEALADHYRACSMSEE